MPKTGNDLEVDRIMTMSISELLDYVLSNPEHIFDSYYSVFNTAINNRADQLKREAVDNA